MTPSIQIGLPPGSRVLVGLSGGADSVALLSLLTRAGVSCLAAHCNFHLRGPESDRDERHCRDICVRLGTELIVRHFDVNSRRKATGESVEMACRALRYDWWNSLIDSGMASYIAVGHHREDNVETFFLNLLRGSGLRGLKGMLPASGRIIRPLLGLTRSEIESYLASVGLTFITDSTNLTPDYKRNRLRLDVLPAIEREFPGAMESTARSMNLLAGNWELYHILVDDMRRRFTDPSDGSIDLAAVRALGPAASTALFELVSPWGLNGPQAADVIKADSDTTRGGKWFDTPSGRCLLDRGRLYPPVGMDAGGDDECEVSLSDSPFSLRTITVGEFDAMRRARALSACSLYLDARALEGSPRFILRGWRQGDRLQPYGMRGSRLVSDLLSDARLTATQKRRVRILTLDDRILWVVGLRASRHYAVEPDTREVVEVTYRGI